MKIKEALLYVFILKIIWLCYKKWKCQKLVVQLQAYAKTPVILIPGLGGSRLYDNEGTLKWCNWQAFLPHVFNNWRDALTVKYNPVKKTFDETKAHSPYRKSHWKTGVFVPTPDFGGCDGVGNVLSRTVKTSWQFQGILDAAAAAGYTEGVNLLGAPYDFRKITSPRVWTEYCRSLKALIEHSQGQVVLLSHSMGSALLLTFFNLYLPRLMTPKKIRAWKAHHIKRWVSVNGAFGGAGKTVRSFLSGDNNGMGYICDTGCHDWYQPLLENASGILWMLPHPQVFSSQAAVLTVGDKTYSARKLPELLETVSPLAAQAYKDTVRPLFTVDAPGVPVVCVTSTQPGTPLHCKYIDDSFDFSTVSMEDERIYYAQADPNVQHMCGDGTVPYSSLMVPQRWLQCTALHPPVTFIRVNQENVAHTSILIEPEPVKLIMSLLT